MPLHAVRRQERGQAIVEYATVIALIGVCLIAILSLVGNVAKNAFEHTSSTVDRNASYSSGGVTGGSGGGGGGVQVIPASSPGAPDSVEVPDTPGDDDPDSLNLVHKRQ